MVDRPLTREMIERDPRISPLGKLILDFLSRRDDIIVSSKIIGEGLAVIPAAVAEEAHRLRLCQLLARKATRPGQPPHDLSLHDLALLPETRQAYAMKPKHKKDAA